MAMPDTTHSDSIPGLIRGILDDLRTLIREEIELARVELRQQAGRAKTAAISFAVAGIALALGGAFLLVAIALGISDLLNWPEWAGFLVVAIVMAGCGLIALGAGRKQIRDFHAVPGETVSSVKENSAWIAKRMSSVRR